MQIQPITSQPNYKGKMVFENGTTNDITRYMTEPLWRKCKEIATLVAQKPYDIFVFQNQQRQDFYHIAANKTLEDAKKINEYTVKIQKNILPDSIVDAAKDAMEMYENYISKSFKG